MQLTCNNNNSMMGHRLCNTIVQINDSTLYFISCLQSQSKFYNDTHQHHIQLRSESSRIASLLKSVYEEGVLRRTAFTLQWELHPKPTVGRGGRGCRSPSPDPSLCPSRAPEPWSKSSNNVDMGGSQHRRSLRRTEQGISVVRISESLWFNSISKRILDNAASMFLITICFLFPCSFMQFCLFTSPFKQNSTPLNYFLSFFCTASSAVWSNPKVYSHPKPLSGMNGEPHLTLGIYKLSWNCIYMPSFMGMGTVVNWGTHSSWSSLKHSFLGGSQRRGSNRVRFWWVPWFRKPREAFQSGFEQQLLSCLETELLREHYSKG